MSGNQPSPELSVVRPPQDDAPRTEPSAPTPTPAPASRESSGPLGTRVPLWALLLALLLGGAVALQQYWRADALETQVGSLENELARLGDELLAYQTHLDGVRSVVGDISERMGSLNALVNRDPLQPVELQEEAAGGADERVEAAGDAEGTTGTSEGSEDAVIVIEGTPSADGAPPDPVATSGGVAVDVSAASDAPMAH